MNYWEKLSQNIPTISFEFFPPKSAPGWATLYSTLAGLSKETPDYISVTYGAGGSTREKTVGLVGRIKNELELDSVAHLTCVAHTREQIHQILQEFQHQGISTILALRGDPPKGESQFTPHPQGFKNSLELIQYIKKNFQFKVACAYYPEEHPESKLYGPGIDFLKQKQDAGADFGISQLFFSNEAFYRFRDTAHAKGIHLPLIAGIMPITLPTQPERWKELCGVEIPETLTQEVAQSPDTVEAGIRFGTRQCLDLLENQVAGIHLYTLNQSKSSQSILNRLREQGHFKND